VGFVTRADHIGYETAVKPIQLPIQTMTRTPQKREIVEKATRFVKYGQQDTVIKSLAEEYDVSTRSIMGWIARFSRGEDLSSRKKGNVGRKTKLNDDIKALITTIAEQYAEQLMQLTEATLCEELAEKGHRLSLSTVHSYVKKMSGHVAAIHLKPSLTETQRLNILQFVLSKVDKRHGFSRLAYFDALNTAHVGESWFYLQIDDNNVLLFPGMKRPLNPTTQHKSHIVKVMFLVAMARPQVRPDNGEFFDGKIGIWPCTERVEAKRSSTNRPKGSLETKSRSMDSKHYLELFAKAGGVLDMVKTKMPWLREPGVIIQHDGASCHNGGGNQVKIREEAVKDGWNIRIETQPAQSPDLNLLDLGFFHSLKSQAAKVKHDARTVDDIISTVQIAYDQYYPHTLDSIWAELFKCYNCILDQHGGNQYELPHEGVRSKGRGKSTKVDLSVDLAAYYRAIQSL